MRLDCVQLTSTGDRPTNQDAMIHHIDTECGVFVVTDGLGGHQAGALAARSFCLSFMRLRTRYQDAMQHQGCATLQAWIDTAIDGMSAFFTDPAQAHEAHTTCAILYLDEHQVITGHCGDSRIYALQHDRALWRTKDHSLPQELLSKGLIEERELGHHPEQNQLTRAINVLKPHQAEIHHYPAPKVGDSFVLCSDGFWSQIKSAEWLQLAHPDANKPTLTRLAKLAIARAQGQSDNLTVQWVRCIA
ncbi:MAG: serine/threonine-protein phosphatase [Methylococcales bacterium]|nr:serine/threonine-protein phosphatase [Methylococcales bacterium]